MDNVIQHEQIVVTMTLQTPGKMYYRLNKNMYLVLYKILVLTSLTGLSLLCGLIPYPIINRYRKRGGGGFRSRGIRGFVSAVICFGGGTLLGIAFLHLMPEMRDRLARLHKEGLYNDLDLPISDILTCGGFFFVYLFDELVHMLIEKCLKAESSREIPSSRARAAAVSSPQREEVSGTEPTLPMVFSLDSHRRRPKHEKTHHETHLHPLDTEIELELRNTDFAKQDGMLSDGTVEQDGQRATGNTPAPQPETESFAKSMPAVSGLITIIALSFHDVFEGLAIGLESKEKSVLFMYLSVAIHKYAIAFCIGLDLALGGTKFKIIFFYMLTYSLVSPIGIVIGMLTVMKYSSTENDMVGDQPVVVILQGLAGGTLIYVVCFEVLQREGSATHVRGIFNVLFVVLGFAVTLVFKMLFAHKHESGNNHHHHHNTS